MQTCIFHQCNKYNTFHQCIFEDIFCLHSCREKIAERRIQEREKERQEANRAKEKALEERRNEIKTQEQQHIENLRRKIKQKVSV
jgi:hypothetical protein